MELLLSSWDSILSVRLGGSGPSPSGYAEEPQLDSEPLVNCERMIGSDMSDFDFSLRSMRVEGDADIIVGDEPQSCW